MTIIGASSEGSYPQNSSSNLGGYISYNGWTFYSPRVRAKFSMTPEKSDDGRTTLCNVYTMTVRAIVTDDDRGYRAFIDSSVTKTINNLKSDQYTARGNIQKIRSCLSKNGGTLRIRGFGFDLSLNSGDSGSMWDTRWGPETLSLNVESIGNGVVWQVDWVLKFSVPECVALDGDGHAGHTAFSGLNTDVSYIGFPFDQQGMLEGLVYEIAYSINHTGLTNRVISGSASMAINRASVNGGGDFNRLTNTADELRELIEPEVPENFRRVGSEWNISSDKRTLSFVIIDSELPGENAYPIGIVDMALDHTVSAEGNFLPVAPMLNCSFSGYFETAKGFALGECFDRVMLVIQTRLDKARKFFEDNTGEAGNPVYLMGCSITESLFGPRRVQFSISYLVINLTGLMAFGTIVERSALFEPVTNAGGNPINNWADWAGTFVTRNVWTQRGVARLVFDPDEDRIVGPCEGEGGTILGDVDLPSAISEGGGSLVTDCPPEDKSYLLWDTDLDIETKNNSIMHQPMGPERPGEQDVQKIESSDNSQMVPTYRQASDSIYTPRTSYTSAGSSVKIVLTSQAIRLGKWPEIPQVNDVKFHEKCNLGRLAAGDTKVVPKRLGKMGKCSLYSSFTRTEYTFSGNLDPSDIQDVIDTMNETMYTTDADSNGYKIGGADDQS